MTAVTLAEVADRIKHMRFRHKLFGGVDEADVWEQIHLLDQDYQNLYRILYQNYKKMLAASRTSDGNASGRIVKERKTSVKSVTAGGGSKPAVRASKKQKARKSVEAQ